MRLLQAAEADDIPVDLVTEAREAVEQSDIEYLRDEIANAIEQTLEGVERVATIVRALKEFSHPGSGVKEATDLNQALESTATVARNEWKYIADLQLELSPDLPPVPCLAGELNQAFLNIIINAAHAIEESTGGRSKGGIKVSSELNGDWVEVRISDNGSGLPGEVLARIFDPSLPPRQLDVGQGKGSRLLVQ
jgi:two-component system, NtrC family, sensor kinase